MKESTIYKEIQEYFSTWVDAEAFSFTARLSRENNWTNNFSRRVIAEYIKFVYLTQVSKNPLTPSDEVDQAWHLHLQYTEKYLEMNNFLKKPLIHGPTKGGPAEDEKFDDWYSRTKDLYLNEFGKAVPTDIWPSPEIRFQIAPKAVRVNPHYNFIISKKSVYTTALITTLISIGVICLSILS